MDYCSDGFIISYTAAGVRRLPSDAVLCLIRASRFPEPGLRTCPPNIDQVAVSVVFGTSSLESRGKTGNLSWLAGILDRNM